MNRILWANMITVIMFCTERKKTSKEINKSEQELKHLHKGWEKRRKMCKGREGTLGFVTTFHQEKQKGTPKAPW